MEVIIITGATGLIGSEAVRFFADKNLQVVGIDNDMRKVFFGEEASTAWNLQRLQTEIPHYQHYNIDIRNQQQLERVFAKYQQDIQGVIHTAAQPSHDWAAQQPFTDFTVNANGTLHLLEYTRKYAPKAAFIFTSTNKVYGDRPNFLPLEEHETRWELASSHPFFANGIDESMSIDQSKHSLFGVSKTAADLLVQEYGAYFGLKTVCFRGGCLTGPNHSGTRLHGFLAYLMKCALSKTPYYIYGYQGKQVRDNIHSYDLVNMFWHFYQNPRVGEVYNVGGGRHSNCSMAEAIQLCEEVTGNKIPTIYQKEHRVGDHIWWISDVSKFRSHYPQWHYHYDLSAIINELFEGLKSRSFS